MHGRKHWPCCTFLCSLTPVCAPIGLPPHHRFRGGEVCVSAGSRQRRHRLKAAGPSKGGRGPATLGRLRSLWTPAPAATYAARELVKSEGCPQAHTPLGRVWGKRTAAAAAAVT